METVIVPPPIDYEDVFAEVAVPSTSTDTTVLDFRVKAGKDFKIDSFGQAWDAALNTFNSYTLLIDGIPHPKYLRKTVQVVPPEQCGYNKLPVPILVPQAARIQVIANSSVAGNVAARVTGNYYDPQ